MRRLQIGRTSGIVTFMAVFACVVPAFGADQPAPFAADIRDAGGTVRVSIQLTVQGWTALLAKVDATPVAVRYENKQYTIRPVVGMRIYLAESTGKGDFNFTEVSDFIGAKAETPLEIVFNQPDTDTIPWFFIKDKKTWMPYTYLVKSNPYGFVIKQVSLGSASPLVLSVSKWPPGDPTAGWGPRPST